MSLTNAFNYVTLSFDNGGGVASLTAITKPTESHADLSMFERAEGPPVTGRGEEVRPAVWVGRLTSVKR